MQIKLETKPYVSLEIDALVTPVFEADDPIQGRVAEGSHGLEGRHVEVDRWPAEEACNERRTHRQDARVHIDSRAGGIEGGAFIARRSREEGSI